MSDGDRTSPIKANRALHEYGADAGLNWSEPQETLRGTIGSFPLLEEDRTLEIYYVKLAVDRDRLRNGDYPDEVSRYFRETEPDASAFPQEPTSDLQYSVRTKGAIWGIRNAT